MAIQSSEYIIRPHITEKAALTSETLNSYVFQVTKKANKTNIAKSIKDIYKVEVVKVNIVKLPRKKIVSKGKTGQGKELKKAYVYLKEGDSISLV